MLPIKLNKVKTNIKKKKSDSSDLSFSNLITTNANCNDRKKQLNRIAATKYRQKKRTEREYVLLQMKNLELHNLELRNKVSSVEAEINFLKNLIKEINNRS